MMLCDFHVHSTFSDGRLSVAQLVDLYGQRGFAAIAITDHLCEEHSFLGQTARFFGRTLTRNTFARYLETLEQEAERAWDRYGMVLIPGIELTKNAVVNTRSAHIVVLGVKQYLSADQEITSLLQQIRYLGGVSIAAHPVHTGVFEPQTYCLWSRRRELADQFDAWEVASGQILFRDVMESGLPLIASSDLHHPRQITSWKTKLGCERHPEAILAAIRAQEVDFIYFTDPEPLKFPLFNMNPSVISVPTHRLS